MFECIRHDMFYIDILNSLNESVFPYLRFYKLRLFYVRDKNNSSIDYISLCIITATTDTQRRHLNVMYKQKKKKKNNETLGFKSYIKTYVKKKQKM